MRGGSRAWSQGRALVCHQSPSGWLCSTATPPTPPEQPLPPADNIARCVRLGAVPLQLQALELHRADVALSHHGESVEALLAQLFGPDCPDPAEGAAPVPGSGLCAAGSACCPAVFASLNAWLRTFCSRLHAVQLNLHEAHHAGMVPTAVDRPAACITRAWHLHVRRLQVAWARGVAACSTCSTL